MRTQDPKLDQRLKREAQFHDEKYSTREKSPRHYRAGPTQYVYRVMRDALGDIRGKRLLEYGCGEGWITGDLARLGAQVHGFDVSPQAIENTMMRLEALGVLDRCELSVMPAERLSYPDATFDMAVGFAIIHHLHLPSALAELYRVLKPGGVAYFAEPLATNPFINLYRRLTPQFRSQDEAPLRLGEMPALLREFSSYEHREFYLTALGAVALVYLPGGARLFSPVSRSLHAIDRALLSALPALGSWAWYTLIKMTK